MNLGNRGNKIKIWTALKDNFIKNNNKVEKKNKMLIEQFSLAKKIGKKKSLLMTWTIQNNIYLIMIEMLNIMIKEAKFQKV